MKRIFLLLLLFGQLISAQLYTKTFGDPKHEPVIFLHGGPGISSVDFEASTAENLAKEKFFVIVYDRRGEGRSQDDNAKFTFAETFADIDNLYLQFNLNKASLIGHSFGGVVATLYADYNPKAVKNLILASAPIDMQSTLKTILDNVKERAMTKQDTATLLSVARIRTVDTTSIQYSSGAFQLGVQNGLYKVKNPTIEGVERHQKVKESDLMKSYKEFLAKTNYKTMFDPTLGFLKNEKYTSIDLSEKLEALKKSGLPIYGIYGKEDGLFDARQLDRIRIFCKQFVLFQDCSHAVFIDRQEVFLARIKEWLKQKSRN